MQQQLTPYYVPAPSAADAGGDDQRTQYNGNSYYNQYGYSPNQAPPHPDASVAWQPTNPNGGGRPVDININFASPPPPTLQEVYAECGTPVNTSPLSSGNNGSFDLLDDYPSSYQQSPNNNNNNNTASMTSYHNDLQTAAFLAAQQESKQLTSSASSRAIASRDDIPSEIIASQERAMAEIQQRRQQHQSKSSSSLTPHSSNSQYYNQELVTLPEVAPSSNPTGSDAVHPNRPVWKKTRGTKTLAGATGGAIVGGIMFGPAFPIGMVLGGATGGYAANKLSKNGERRAQRKWEQSSFQRGAEHSSVISHTLV